MGQSSVWGFYLLASLSACAGASGDFLLNRWAKKGGSIWWIVGGYVACNIAIALFLKILKDGHYLSQSAAVFGAVNGFLIVACSWVLFRETMSPLGWAGVIVVFVGLVLIELGR